MTRDYVTALLALSRANSPALIAAVTECLVTGRAQSHCAITHGVAASNLAVLIRRLRTLDLRVQELIRMYPEPTFTIDRIDFMLANFSRASSVPVMTAAKRFLVEGKSLNDAAAASKADVHNVWRMICNLRALNEKLIYAQQRCFAHAQNF